MFTVAAVKLMSTGAMILYPVLVRAFGPPDAASAVFLGAAIHDVAQVVGAGFSVSPEVGETATLVKLMRVAMLAAPVVIIASVSICALAGNAAGGTGGKRAPLLPWFVVAVLAISGANSASIFPKVLAMMAATLSKWALASQSRASGSSHRWQGSCRLPGGGAAGSGRNRTFGRSGAGGGHADRDGSGGPLTGAGRGAAR